MTDQFDPYKSLIKAVEQTRFLTNPYSQLYKELARSTELFRGNVFETNKAIATELQMPETNKAIAAALQMPEINKAIAAVQIPAQSLDVTKALAASQKVFEQIQETQARMAHLVSAHQVNFLESLNQQAGIWQKLMQPNQEVAQRLRLTMPQIQEASVAWNSSLRQSVRRFQEVNLFARKSDLAVRLLEPSRIYTAFIKSTIQRLEQNESAKIAKALRASLRLAEVQLLTTTDAVSALVAAPTDDELPSATRPLALPIVQQNELVAAADITDEADIVQFSPATGAAANSRMVLNLIIKCNEVAKVAEQPEIFKPTTRLLEAFVDLPWLVPTDKRTLADFVDCLYFIFYEGAGKDNLRFLSAKGGALDTADCDFIWCIKHLRNKWLRHDADHGKEADIKKSWKELSAKFNWLGLEHAPITSEHFRHLHRRLLKEAEAFLGKILDKLTNNG